MFLIKAERVTQEDLERDLQLTAFTGRQREMDTILRSFERVCGGEGQFVTLNGEAGLGKSRLLFEFRAGLDAEEVALLIGRCQSYGSRTPYLPFVDILRMAVGIDVLKAADVEVDRVVTSIRTLGEVLEPLMPVYLRLLGLEHPDFPVPAFLEGEQLHRAVMESVAALMITMAASRPLVVVLEDWHWADEGSRNALAHVVDLLASHRILLMLSYRPTFMPDWGHPEGLVPIRLRPLEAQEIEAMILSLLGVEQVPKHIASLLMGRTEGNPFFLEELLNTLLEQQVLLVIDGRLEAAGEIDHSAVPATVQAVLRTQIERLSEDARSLLLAASVAGRMFTRALLERILPDLKHLDALLNGIRNTGLIQQTRILPEVEYRFKHALVQDVAYESLLSHQKKRLHGAFGDAIEALYPEYAEEQPFVVAQHFAEGERWAQAVHYGKKAYDRAWQLVQYKEAHAINESIISWLSLLPYTSDVLRSRIRAIFAKETLCEGLFLQAERKTCMDQLQQEIALLDDPVLTCELAIRKGDLLIEEYNFKEAEDILDDAIILAKQDGARHLLGRSLRSIGWLYWHTGRYDQARQSNLEVLELLRSSGATEEMVGVLINLISISINDGDIERTEYFLNEAFASLSPGLSMQRSSLLYMKGRVEYLRGDTEAAVRTLEEAVGVWDAMYSGGKNESLKGTFVRIPLAQLLLGQIKLELGDIEEAERWYKIALPLQRKSAIGRQDELADVLLVLGNFCMQMGRYDESLTTGHFSRLTTT